MKGIALCFMLSVALMTCPVTADQADDSQYQEEIEKYQDANIITIIDHHGAGTVTTGNQLIYDARPLGSTATIVCIRFSMMNSWAIGSGRVSGEAAAKNAGFDSLERDTEELSLSA